MATLPPTSPVSMTVATGSDGTNAVPLAVDAGGELQVDISSSTLPVGASTEAKQDGIITALGSPAQAGEAAAATAGLALDATLGSPAQAGEAAAATAGLATEATISSIDGRLESDPYNGSLVVIDAGHHQTHEGNSFRVGHYTTSGSSLIIAFKVPDQALSPHLTWEFSTESKAHLTISEGSAWTTNTGTRQSVQKSNRRSSNTSIVQGDGTGAGGWAAGEVVKDPTGVAGGATIANQYTFVSKTAGGDVTHSQEIILATNQTYVVTMTSDDGAKGMQVRLLWYEA